jgi:two-component system, OmpR family, phosphate regulon sensor histidine kinase PhoR
VNHYRTRYILFYALFFYVLAQLCWWGFQLIRIYQKNPGSADNQEYKIWMVIGEGSVFAFLLFLGFRLIDRSMKKDITRAQIESTFLLSVTHELKTPLTSIRLMLDTMLKRKTDEATQQQLLEDAKKELLRLQNQIENILLTTRALSSAIEKRDEEIAVEELLKEPLGKIQKWFPSTPIEVKEIPDLRILFDRELFSCVMVNLIENAIFHGDRQSPIQIEIHNKMGKLHILIKDSGEGIPDEILLALQKKNYHFNKVRDSKVKGTGLGLYLVDNIIQRYQGEISFSQNTPKGTLATVIIPI